jgi:enoyl-CoA hydratase
MSGPVSCELRDAVAQFVRDDGMANVMPLAMLESLQSVFDRTAEGPAVTVLHSTRPGVFSAGSDLDVFASGDVAGSLGLA